MEESLVLYVVKYKVPDELPCFFYACLKVYRAYQSLKDIRYYGRLVSAVLLILAAPESDMIGQTYLFGAVCKRV